MPPGSKAVIEAVTCRSTAVRRLTQMRAKRIMGGSSFLLIVILFTAGGAPGQNVAAAKEQEEDAAGFKMGS